MRAQAGDKVRSERLAGRRAARGGYATKGTRERATAGQLRRDRHQARMAIGTAG